MDVHYDFSISIRLNSHSIATKFNENSCLLVNCTVDKQNKGSECFKESPMSRNSLVLPNCS